MKRNFVLLISGILLSGLTGAAQTFQVSSQGNLALRQEGKDEKVAGVKLVATQAGTIPAKDGIEFVYATTIGNAKAINATPATYLSCTGAALGPACTAATVTASGNAVSILFAADTAVAVGDTVLLQSVRLDATTLPGSATVNVNLNSLPAAIVTFIGNPQIVGTVAGSKAVTVGLSPTPGFVSPLPGPFSILTCSPPLVPAPATSFVVNVAENFNSALSSGTDEGTDSTNGSNIQIVINNVPPNTTVTPNFPVYCPNTAAATCKLTLDASGFGSGAALTTGSTQGSLTFTFTVDTTNPTALEDVDIYFNVQFTGSGTLPINEMSPAVATFSLIPTTSTSTPYFNGVAEPYNSLGGNVIVIADCVTDLLFPWASAYLGKNATTPSTASNANFSTALVVSNTTKDPFKTGGAVPQSAGSCTFWMYPNDGTTPGVLTVGPIAAGGTAIFDISAAYPTTFTPSMIGKSGYIIGTCGFQNAHAYVNIYDNATIGPPVTVQTYLGLVIPNPAIFPRNPAGGPKAPGEGLVH